MFYYTEIKKNNEIVMDLYSASVFVEPNSIVLPFDFSENWLHMHHSNYLGVDKSVVILENYECDKDYFPLKWNFESMPKVLLGQASPDDVSCVNWKLNWENEPVSANYVLIIGDLNNKNEECHSKIKEILEKEFTLKFKSISCELYEWNGNE